MRKCLIGLNKPTYIPFLTYFSFNSIQANSYSWVDHCLLSPTLSLDTHTHNIKVNIRFCVYVAIQCRKRRLLKLDEWIRMNMVWNRIIICLQIRGTSNDAHVYKKLIALKMCENMWWWIMKMKIRIQSTCHSTTRMTNRMHIPTNISCCRKMDENNWNGAEQKKKINVKVNPIFSSSCAKRNRFMQIIYYKQCAC